MSNAYTTPKATKSDTILVTETYLRASLGDSDYRNTSLLSLDYQPYEVASEFIRKAKSEKQREQTLFALVDEQVKSNTLSATVSSLIKTTWERIQARSRGVIQTPHFSISQEEKSVILFWNDQEEHYLEIEIMPDATLEFFYRNRKTEKEWFGDSHVNNDSIAPDVFHAYLNNFNIDNPNGR
jgi:hypothetical protein